MVFPSSVFSRSPHGNLRGFASSLKEWTVPEGAARRRASAEIDAIFAGENLI